MLKYVSKFILDILPSLVATVIGAYIVNHYIVAKPATDAPVAASVSTVLPKTDAKVEARTEVKNDKSAEAPSDVPDAPAVKTKVPVDKSADTASTPAEGRRHQPVSHEKTAARSSTAPAAVVPDSLPSAEERRDANDLARAAIERLRNSSESAARIQEAAHAQEQAHVVPTPSVQALPPPILVSTPRTEPFNSVTGSLKPSDQPGSRVNDARRPPAEIPSSGPLELHVEAEPTVPSRTSVADDVLSAAKSVFHAVIPR